MSQIPAEAVLNRFKAWFVKQSVQLKEDILLFAYSNRPRKDVKLSRLLGEENTGKGFDIDLAQGQESERELRDILTGKIEVKTDYLVSNTGNVAIEFECSGRPSGIETTESPWWAIVLDGDRYRGKQIVLISTSRLREIVRGAKVVSGGDNGRARMYLVPVRRLLA